MAECARDGLRLLETKFPDVALVDLGLPDGSGLDIVCPGFVSAVADILAYP